jgi:hypothetical protein
MIIDELFEGPQLCPECGGISFSDLILAEKKDACYYKVKASAKVWPSAYASGRLVQCRKKGAANYGNKSEGMAETRRGQIPMTLQPGETDNIEPENISGFRTLPAYKQGQAAQQKAGKQLIQKSPHTYQSDQDWAYRQGAFDAQQAAMFANFGKSKPLTIEGGEQQKGADYRDPKEVDYDDEYDAMVARVKRLAGVGPMRTVYDPNKRVYRNMPTAQQPKK